MAWDIIPDQEGIRNSRKDSVERVTVLVMVRLTMPADYATLGLARNWGASCPRQGSLLSPILVRSDIAEPSSSLDSADFRHRLAEEG